MKSPKYDTYKDQYARNWITKATLRQWVSMQARLPMLGITAEEYKEITGEDYEP